MADRSNPEIYTKKGEKRVRQTMTIEKLNSLRHLINTGIKTKDIAASINMSKTTVIKYTLLIHDLIDKETKEGIENPGADLSPILYKTENKNVDVNYQLREEITNIIGEDWHSTADEIHTKLVEIGYEINLNIVKKCLKDMNI